MSSSDAFSPCRLKWRRSRWQPVALCALALAAIAGLWLADMPQIACTVCSVLVFAYVTWLLYRESRRPESTLSWSGRDALWQVECDGRMESLRHVGASFRGRLVVLTLANDSGHMRRYTWWPDTIDAHGRRALRLALRAKATVTPTQPTLAQ